MGSGLHHRTFQGLVNVIHFGMTVDEAINAPDFFMPSFTPAGVKVAVPKGRFPTHVLDETGYDTIEFDTEGARFGGEGMSRRLRCAATHLFAALDSVPNRVKHLPKHAGRRVVDNPSREPAARVAEHLIHNDGALRAERNQGPRAGASPDVAGAFNVGPASSPAGTRTGGEGLGLDP